MAEFRKKKAIQRAKDEKTYLMLDKYTRGTKEMKMIDFEAEMEKNSKKNQKKKASPNEGKNKHEIWVGVCSHCDNANYR